MINLLPRARKIKHASEDLPWILRLKDWNKNYFGQVFFLGRFHSRSMREILCLFVSYYEKLREDRSELRK